MAIYLQTGVPGAGKTSFALDQLLFHDIKSLKEQGRPIYTSIDMYPESMAEYGIIHLFDALGPGKDYDPKEPDRKCFDPTKIHDLPVGSYIIVDEAQFIFPARSAASKVPEYVKKFETHRHRGHDFVLITQAPNFLDHHFRGMYERHKHYSRTFGTRRVVEFTYEGYCASPEPEITSKIAQKKARRVKRDVFNHYVSTAQNTHRSRFPWRQVAYAFALMFVSCSFAWYGISNSLMFSDEDDEASSSPSPRSASGVSCVAVEGVTGGRLVLRLPDGSMRFSGSVYTVSGPDLPKAFGSFLSSDSVAHGPGGPYPLCSA